MSSMTDALQRKAASILEERGCENTVAHVVENGGVFDFVLTKTFPVQRFQLYRRVQLPLNATEHDIPAVLEAMLERLREAEAEELSKR